MFNKHHRNCIYELWFPKKIKEIFVITSEEPSNKKSEDASTTSENYAFLDNVGDKDALIETSIFLTRYYPNANLKRLFPREFNERDDFDKNLVIIGGPINNNICERVMDRIKSNVKYSTTDWNMQVNDMHYDSIYSDDNGMEKDYGYFAAFANPIRLSNRIVLLNGMNTFGVVGAFRAFSDLDESYNNFITINDKVKSFSGTGSFNFECFFEVFVHNCGLKDCTKVVIDCPIVESKKIFLISEKYFAFEEENQNVILLSDFDSTDRKENNIMNDDMQRIAMAIKILNNSINELEIRKIRIEDAKSKLNPITQTDELINSENRIKDLENDINKRNVEIAEKRQELLNILLGSKDEFKLTVLKIEERIPLLSYDQLEEISDAIVQFRSTIEKKGLIINPQINEDSNLQSKSEDSLEQKRAKVKITLGLLPKIEIEKDINDPDINTALKKFWLKIKETVLRK